MTRRPARQAAPATLHFDPDDPQQHRALFRLAETVATQTYQDQNHWEWLADLEDAYFTAVESLYGGSCAAALALDPVREWPARGVLRAPGTNVVILVPLRTFEERVRYLAAAMSLVADYLSKQTGRGRAELHVRQYSDILHRFADRICRRPRG